VPAHQRHPHRTDPAVEYVARRATEDGGVSVHVLTACGHQRGLDPRFDLRRHSPDGFQMSYAGSGPAQLALALLADALGNDDLAQDLYQKFKAQVVANVPHDLPEWRITRQAIKDWADRTLADRAAARGLPPPEALDVWADQLGE
jgi:hypothetical protein